MRYSLRTLLMLMLFGGPALAGLWLMREDLRKSELVPAMFLLLMAAVIWLLSDFPTPNRPRTDRNE